MANCLSLIADARLFKYGSAAGDQRVTTKTSLTDEYVSNIVLVPHGLPVRDGQLLNGVYVSTINTNTHIVFEHDAVVDSECAFLYSLESIHSKRLS